MPDRLRPRVLVAWEGGGNFGHIAKISQFAHVLADHCDITVAAKDPCTFRRVSATARVRMVAAPHSPPRPVLDGPPLGFADNLRVIGWDEPLELAALVESWQTLFELIAPDCVILQSSPTALLAHFGTSIPAFVMGTGFDYPPFDAGPLPFVHWAPRIDKDRIRAVESDMISRVKTAMDYLGRDAPTSFAQLFADAAPMLTSIPQLDHYAPLRAQGQPLMFHGWFDRLDQRATVQWQNTRGKRIVAYLWPESPTFAPAMRGMADLAATHSIFVVAPGMPDQAAETCTRRGIEFARGPVDLAPLLAQADLFVSHGSHGTVLSAMRAGVPQLCLPNQMEQMMLSHRMAETGNGRAMVGSFKPADVSACIDTILHDPAVRTSAAALAQTLRSSGYDADRTIPAAVLDRLAHPR